MQEETWLQGTLLSNFFFGIQVTLCAFSFLAVLNKRATNHCRMRIAVLAYIVVSFAITTAGQGLLLEFIQMGFITHRNYPGGPSAFFNDEYSVPVNIASTILYVCGNWINESLLVRLSWLNASIRGDDSHPRRRYGGVMWCAVPATDRGHSECSGSLFISSTFHSVPLVSYTLAYGISSLILNLTATGFIAGRLLAYRRRVVGSLGHAQGQHYISIAAVVVESAAVYTIFLIVVIVAYAIGSPATNMLQQVIEQVQTITSLLIILRVARGEGWHSTTETEVVSAVVSSWNTQVGPHPDPNVIQLNVVSTQREEEVDMSMSRKRASVV
ncbi:hypothetical protein JVT61DRAFT_8149 [Boletus reticuloceps]|uniref:Uncharacterized protein n=1 Tax=Boletus reticuloceps TaxID=495285 RepID=A0A8I2YYG6_9AGAM|nr:hypothetical protein JVT61DRAFT_8149 [Boletus reticuloceps]